LKTLAFTFVIWIFAILDVRALPLSVTLLQVSDAFSENRNKILIVYSELSTAEFPRETILKPGDRFYDMDFQKVDYLLEGFKPGSRSPKYLPYKVFFSDRSTHAEVVYQTDGYQWHLMQTEQGAAANP